MFQKIEKKFNLDADYFLKGGFWLTLAQFFNALKSLILGMVLARFLSKDGFGIYAYILSIFYITNLFGAPGMGSAILQSVARGLEGTFSYLTKKVFLWSLAGTIFLLGFAVYYGYSDSTDYGYTFLVLALIFPLYSISTNFTYYFTGKKQFRLRMIMEALVSIIIVFTTISFLIFDRNVFIIVVITVIAQTIPSLFFCWYAIKNSNNQIDLAAYDYGKKLSFTYIIPTIKLQIDKVVVANFLGYTSTAVYNVATAIGEQVYGLAKIVGSLVIPKTATLTAVQLRKNFRKKMILLLFIFGGLSVVLFFITPYLITLLFSNKYNDSIPYARIIILFIPIRSLAVIIRSIHESQKNLRIIKLSSNYLSILEFLLMLAGVYVWGIWGIISAKIIADMINLIFQFVYIFRKHPRAI